jgi:hypothetical protein
LYDGIVATRPATNARKTGLRDHSRRMAGWWPKYGVLLLHFRHIESEILRASQRSATLITPVANASGIQYLRE